MKLPDWTVLENDDGRRPADPLRPCFYCRSKVGEQHEIECVIRQKTVVIQVTLDMVVTVPEHWKAEDVEFNRNLGTRCSNGTLGEIAELSRRLDESQDPCACRLTTHRYIREATEEDHKANEFEFTREMKE